MDLVGVLEGLLFVLGDEGITLDQISSLLEISKDEAKELLLKLKQNYEKNDRGLRIRFLGNAFKLTTKEEHKEFYEKLVTDNKTTNLSNAALEVLAVIAYNEPITRLKIDEIRGVNSSQIVKRLVARGFVKVCGKDETIGRPNLYKTTNDFLDYFGLSSKEDLPKIINEEKVENEVGDLYDSTYKEEY